MIQSSEAIYFSYSLVNFLNSFGPKAITKRKKKVLCSILIFFFSFTTEQKLGYALNASFSFCLLLSCCLLVCICVHRCIIFNFDMKLFSVIPEHFLVSY